MSKDDELREIEELIAKASADVNRNFLSEQEYLNEINIIQARVKKEIQELTDKAQNLHTSNFHKRKEIRELNARREMLRRQAEDEARNNKLLEKYLELKDHLEEIKNNFSWSDRIMPHQVEGAEIITLQKRLILADVMGLGKTLTAISALDFIQEATKDASPENLFITDNSDRFPVGEPAGKRVLYLSSAELSYGVWNEFRKWAPHRNVVFLTGQPKATRRVVIDTLKNMSDQYVVIINYEAWRKDLNLLPILSELKFDTIIFDEAHKLKEGKSNIGHKGVLSIMTSTPSPYRIALTGTPILNKPQELFNQLALLDPYLFYSEKEFLKEYCWQIKDDSGRLRWSFAPGGIELLYRKIGRIILRRTKKDAGINLPPLTIIDHDIDIDEELYPHQARAREEMRKWGSIQLDPENNEKGFVSAAAQIAVLMRLRQIECWPAGIKFKDPLDLSEDPRIIHLDVQESQKMDYIINPTFDMGIATEALGSGERLIIFSQFTQTLKEMHERFLKHGYTSCVFIGETPRHIREEIKADFDASMTPSDQSKYQVVLANYKVGGEGVNFTGASQMIIADEEWNPGKRNQAYDRMNRIGQELPMTVHVVRVKNTVDTWMRDLIDFKENVVGGFESTFNENMAYKAIMEGKI